MESEASGLTAGKDERRGACTDKVLVYSQSIRAQIYRAAFCRMWSLPMKAFLAVLAPAVLLTGPAFAAEGHDVLKASLINATREEMSVAPWVAISVAEQVRGDKLVWVADTGGGQRYACAAAASADAVLAGEVTCTRLGAAPAKYARRSQPYELTQRSRIPFPGQYVDYSSPPPVLR
jgi:hypothetical protein